MKNFLILLSIIVSSSSLAAQTQSKKVPLSIAYFSQFGYQPGVKIGVQINIKNWKKNKANHSQLKNLYISPQIGFYTNPNIHTSYLINTDLGYKRIKNCKGTYSAWSLGLTYLLQSQITEWKINLSDGSKEKIRNNWNWFLPTVNYEFGKAINTNINWYSKFSYGIKMSSSRESTSAIFIELGLTFNIF